MTKRRRGAWAILIFFRHIIAYCEYILAKAGYSVHRARLGVRLEA
jgi:hypothetical protein